MDDQTTNEQPDAVELPLDPTAVTEPTALESAAEPTVGEIVDGPLDESYRAIEAVLMVADEPVSPQLLGELLELSPSIVEERCVALGERYEREGRGFVLARVAGGYRFQSHPEMAGYVERFVVGDQAPRLTGAALETLAIVAYKQPISRAQIAQIRGVSVDGTMKTLVQRGYVAEVGVDPGPGQAVLFGTTPSFLANLGLDRLNDLPPLGDLVPGADVMEVLEASLRVDGASGRTVRSDANAALAAPSAAEADGEAVDE